VSLSGPAPDNSLRRFEVGAQTADLHFNVGCPMCPRPEFALGVSGAWNVNQCLALESRFSITPQAPSSNTSALWGGHGSEFLAGIRGSARGAKWGLFAEAEPGFVSWSNIPASVAFTTTPTPTATTLQSGWRNFPAIELGGGVEYSPTSRGFIRLDLGDLLVRDDFSQIATFNGGSPYQDCPGAV